jgi:hypothetical protein
MLPIKTLSLDEILEENSVSTTFDWSFHSENRESFFKVVVNGEENKVNSIT